MMSARRGLAIAAALLVAASCQTTNTVPMQEAALTLKPEALARRELGLRRFDTPDERMILSACSGVLQDLGFTLEESSVATGLLVASKNRDAMEAEQVAGQIFVAALITAMGGTADPVWDRDQKIRISIITQPALDGAGVVVRVTFQRVVWNTKNQVSKVETIGDPGIYQQFFDKLSQSVFLEAHQI